MTYHLIPPEKIPKIFYLLQQQSTELDICQGVKDQLSKLFKYVETNWILSTLWPPKTWSVFMQPIRTNNDAEGWHNRINSRAGQNGVNFYLLVDFLHEEAKSVSLQVVLLCQETLTRRLRGKNEELQGNLFNLWDDYGKGSFKTISLIENCATLYCEYNKLKFEKDSDDSKYDYSSEEE